MIKKQGLWIGFFVLSMMGLTQPAIAHGARLDYTTTDALEVTATYDSGTPMADAQVVIYAPNDPATPWLTGATNDTGQFVFVPDRTIPGNWEVQVRQAGHGDIVTIPVTEAATIQGGSSSSALSPLQKGLVGGAIIWGFVGTALYFSPRKT